MEFPSPDEVSRRVIELLGGADEARQLINERQREREARWNHDTESAGRVLRAHLYVEHYLTTFIESANPRLGSISNTRIGFADKVKLLPDSEWLVAAIRPGLVRLNTIRNRLSHRLATTVTDDDVNEILSVEFFKPLRSSLTNPGRIEDDPLGIIEQFAQFAASVLSNDKSPLSAAFAQAFEELTPKKALMQCAVPMGEESEGSQMEEK